MADYLKEGQSSLEGVRKKIAERLKTDQTKIQVGYSGEPSVERREGDVWQDGYKTWTIKNGIKQTISKLQDARMPLFCPNCSGIMTLRLDTKMYRIHQVCFDCVIKMETKLRLEGKWEEYEQKKLKENEISYLKYNIDRLKEALNEVSNPEFILQDGRIETWSVDTTFVKNEIQSDISKLEARLTFLESEDGIGNI